MICIKSLRKYFTDESDITYRDLTFEDGKSYVLLGASGCGKSTLLHMISGVLSPTSGRILINGTEADSYTFKQDYYWMQGDNRHNSPRPCVRSCLD